MNNLIKNLIINLLPVLVFVVAEEFLSMNGALIVSFIFALIQFVVFYIIYKKLDYFILFDLLLIALFSYISYYFKNDLFFKLKPAIMELVLMVYLGALILKPKVLKVFLERNLGEMANYDLLAGNFKRTLNHFQILLAIHVLLVILTAIYFSTKVWAFTAKIFFYILLAIYMGSILLIKKRENQKFKGKN